MTATQRPEVAFWLAYLIVPMLTGWFHYTVAPDEVYDESRHVRVESHEVDDDDKGNWHLQPDKWRSKATGKVFTRELFRNHNRAEATRLAVDFFGYGILGCIFYAYSSRVTDRRTFKDAFIQSMFLNSAFSLIVFLSL